MRKIAKAILFFPLRGMVAFFELDLGNMNLNYFLVDCRFVICVSLKRKGGWFSDRNA